MATLSTTVLETDAAQMTEALEASIRDIVFHRLGRRGAVVGLSGGIDSSVTAALCARALGTHRVLGILMPEHESSDDSATLAQLVAEGLGISAIVEEIGPALEAIGCYRRRDDAIRSVIPEYGEGWKSKIVLPGIGDGAHYQIFSVVAQSPSGEVRRVRLTPEAYLGVVAATNFKQRMRKMVEYHHADRLWYAVAGTPNRLEYSLGFFVKNGDGSSDFAPIAHLYKTQVYALGKYLGLPEEILLRTPTTDTYSLAQTQEEFYFSLPLQKMDLCLYGKNNGVPAAELAAVAGLTPEQVEQVYRDIGSKRKTTRYQHLKPLLVEAVDEIDQ